MLFEACQPIAATERSAFTPELLVGLSHPKGLLFLAAFLPQFIRHIERISPQYVLLAITGLGDCMIMLVYAFGG
jgi:threonine/homoserine/homoserine lactone efflux protein